ncbi:VRR-NUC domain-containing protein [Thermorudis peleae]|uniref:VRR-NUC domain-containing protein n=1 Tax=Thermorudis peleae TaxID=1382356 RepID=UPI00068DF5BE|nr:VRR-NUC domain-containing protein [Thermorudis peleae]
MRRLLGWQVYHTWISVRSPAGFPDLVLAKPGRPLILTELKTERGKLSPAQEAWLAVLQQVPGIIVRVWRPSDWDEIVAALQGAGRLRPMRTLGAWTCGFSVAGACYFSGFKKSAAHCAPCTAPPSGIVHVFSNEEKRKSTLPPTVTTVGPGEGGMMPYNVRGTARVQRVGKTAGQPVIMGTRFP